MTAEITRNKTIEVATYPNGTRVPILRERGMWRWDISGSASSHKDAAKRNAIEAGATITREPNPNYRPRLRLFEKLMSGIR